MLAQLAKYTKTTTHPSPYHHNYQMHMNTRYWESLVSMNIQLMSFTESFLFKCI